MAQNISMIDAGKRLIICRNLFEKNSFDARLTWDFNHIIYNFQKPKFTKIDLNFRKHTFVIIQSSN